MNPSDATSGSASPPLSASAQKVQEAIRARGLDLTVIELAVPVRTAADAAREVGCEVAQIAKSIIFRAASGRGVLVITSGSNRVNEERVTELIGESIGRASPDFVREVTGFAIGGVPPLGHATEMITLIDEDLLKLPFLWAAAGHPNSLFRLPPADLPKLADGRVAKVT
jgi:prolyl-tRNA editing enzyme YbaK/EbsC (Cys-tRNA(Pro) deacylase)